MNSSYSAHSSKASYPLVNPFLTKANNDTGRLIANATIPPDSGMNRASSFNRKYSHSSLENRCESRKACSDFERQLTGNNALVTNPFEVASKQSSYKERKYAVGQLPRQALSMDAQSIEDDDLNARVSFNNQDDSGNANGYSGELLELLSKQHVPGPDRKRIGALFGHPGKKNATPLLQSSSLLLVQSQSFRRQVNPFSPNPQGISNATPDNVFKTREGFSTPQNMVKSETVNVFATHRNHVLNARSIQRLSETQFPNRPRFCDGDEITSNLLSRMRAHPFDKQYSHSSPRREESE